MTRREFMSELDYKLRPFPREERMDALNYYTEYFEDAHIGLDDQVPENMQSINDIVSQLMSECVGKMSVKKPETVKKGVSAVWLAILGVFAAPIAFPVLIAVLSVAFAICVTIAALLFLGVVAGVSVFAAGIICIVAAFPVFTVSVATGVFVFGIGLILAGVGAISMLLVVYLVKWSCFGIVKFFNFITRKSREKKMKKNMQSMV